MNLHHTDDAACPLCEDKLKSADAFLIHWFRRCKERYPNLHLSWAYRDCVSQEQAVLDGKSKLHFPNSAHNKVPALALDLFQIDEDGVGRWSPIFFAKLNSENEAAREPLLWGGKFKDLGDFDHFEIQDPR